MQSTAHILGNGFSFKKSTADSFRDFSPAHFTTFAAYWFKLLREDLSFKPLRSKMVIVGLLFSIYFFIRTRPSQMRRYNEPMFVYERHFQLRHNFKKEKWAFDQWRNFHRLFVATWSPSKSQATSHSKLSQKEILKPDSMDLISPGSDFISISD